MKIVSNGKTVSEYAVWLGTEFDKMLGHGWEPTQYYLNYAKEHNLVIVSGGGYDNCTINIKGEEYSSTINFQIEMGGSFYINKNGIIKFENDPELCSTFKKIVCNYNKRNIHLNWKISTEIPHVVWRQLDGDFIYIHSHCLIFSLNDI